MRERHVSHATSSRWEKFPNGPMLPRPPLDPMDEPIDDPIPFVVVPFLAVDPFELDVGGGGGGGGDDLPVFERRWPYEEHFSHSIVCS